MLDLDLIRIDGGTQSREKIDESVVAEYAEAMKAGVQFPPVIVFFDGVDRWLADGFHRYHGARLAGLAKIYEDIAPGSRRDAVLYSLRANATHGLKRTHADKRKAVETLLKDAEWAAWSDRKIAEVCGVGNQLVGEVRRAICVNHTDTPATRTVERNGKTYQQNTAKIGRTPAPAPADSGAPPAHPPASDTSGSALDMTDRRGIDPAPAPPSRATAPAEPPPPEYTELDAARDQIADLQAALALANLGEVPEADRTQAAELIEHLQGEVKGLSAQLRAVTNSRDFLMQENAQMKQQLAAQRREIDRLKAGAA
jgi:hypothetical protein